MSPDKVMMWITIAGYIGFFLAMCAAGFERFRNKRGEQGAAVAAAKDELIKSLMADRDSWKSRCEVVSLELTSYREATHKATDLANAQILMLTNENARLAKSTDVTPLLHYTTEQSQINVKVLSTLDVILVHLKKLTRSKIVRKKPVKK